MIKDEIQKSIKTAIKSAQRKKKLPPKLEIPNIEVFYPKNEKYGDWSTNISGLISKQIQKSPLEVSGIIADELSKDNKFEKVGTAKPVFINSFASKEFLQKQVKEILVQNEKYGSSELGKNQKIHLDFVSANPTGPLTLGNARGGPFGDILANIFEWSGYKVIREYYVNDAGKQIDSLGHSILKDKEAEYYGKYIDELSKKIKGKDYREAGEKAAEIILSEMIKPSIESLGIKFDNWFSEKKLQKSGEVDKAIDKLQKRGLVYEKDGAEWFKSTLFGDDKDRVVIKADGQKTYFGSDIAYHLDKIKRGSTKLIDIWGADHHGDVVRIKGALEALGYKDKLDVILTQLVRVIKDGQELKMSKRSGTFITIDDLLDEVGRDAVRFIFAMYAPDSHINFDIQLAKEKSEKNPVYYVQYAHARIHGILEKATNFKPQIPKIKFQLLNHWAEKALIKQLIRMPDLIRDIALDYQVQKLPYYAIDLASVFHQFYNTCRVISDDSELTKARLSLILATKIVLKICLDLLGVSAPEKM
jgi:arginyl-tRNA synthetase